MVNTVITKKIQLVLVILGLRQFQISLVLAFTYFFLISLVVM